MTWVRYEPGAADSSHKLLLLCILRNLGSTKVKKSIALGNKGRASVAQCIEQIILSCKEYKGNSS